MGIEDILMHDESLFSNINAFDPDYVPPNYNYRDNQMEAMAMGIRPAISGGKPVNSVVLGSCATGKTTAIKKVFELVEKSTEKVICVYINCQLHTTRFGIFSQIYKKLFGHLPPETGVPFSRIYTQIMQYLQKENKSLIVALDDVNYLFQSNNANTVFFDLLRSYEEFPGVKVGVFAILSDLELKYAFDKNVNSVFIPQEIIFQPYSFSEIVSILTDRVNAGFFANVISDELIEKIAQHTFDSGDLRVGINLLKLAANIAEANASKQITEEHVDQAIDSLVSVNISETLKSLSDVEKDVIKLIIESNEILTSGKLADKFKKQNNLSYASFNRVLEKLEFLRLIDTRFTGKGVRGNSREIILRFNYDDYKDCIKL